MRRMRHTLRKRYGGGTGGGGGGMTVQVSSFTPPMNVKTFSEASALVEHYIAQRGLGSDAWYRELGVGGAPIMRGGEQVAYVSYNGRVWYGTPDDPGPHEEIPT